MSDSAGLLSDPAEVRAILIASAKAGEAISYSEVLGLLGHHFTRPKMRQLCKVLAYVDDEAEERGEPALAVLVVRQSDGLPGQGWWVGGAKKHGETNFTLEANVPYTIVDTQHPIMQGMSNFAIKDEAFYLMTWSKQPEVHVLATAVMDATPTAKQAGHAGEVVPQIWTYEKQLTPAPTGQPYRAFVWMQGHFYANFSNPQVQPMLLRGIAWAAKRSADTLMTERPGRGGRGTTDAPAAAAGRGRGN